MAGGVRVGVAFGAATLAATPTFTYLTATDNLVASFSVDRGRSFEIDRTETSTASVEIEDTDGVLDPTNTGGPYYGQIEPLLQIRLELWNPVTSAYSTLFRGFIEDYNYAEDSSQKVNRLTIDCVDAFAILSAIEMQPGEFGTAPPAGSEGNLFFATDAVDARIIEVLGSAGWPAALYTVFTGNVTLQDSIYSPGETVLQVVQDAADAEFPGVANVYVSRTGKVTFHGRLSKFDPEGVSAGAGGAWPFTHWKAGDGTAVAASISDTAQIRGVAFNRGLARIINSALSTPQGILDAAIAGQLVKDATSIGLYGIRSWSAENLLTLAGTTTGNTANLETKAFASYYIANYAEPRNRVSDLSFRSLAPTDPRAAANWALLCGAEVSDKIDVSVTHPGGGGFNLEPFFIEGVHYDVEPLNGVYADVTLKLDVSPAAYFSDGSMFT